MKQLIMEVGSLSHANISKVLSELRDWEDKGIVISFLIIAAERQRGSTLFLTLHEVLAFSCPVPDRVIYSRNLDVCGGDVSKAGGK